MSSKSSSVCLYLLLLLLVSGTRTAVSHWIVKTLPGFPGELPFKLETGYALLVSAVKTIYLNLFSKDFIENGLIDWWWCWWEFVYRYISVGEGEFFYYFSLNRKGTRELILSCSTSTEALVVLLWMDFCTRLVWLSSSFSLCI